MKMVGKVQILPNTILFLVLQLLFSIFWKSEDYDKFGCKDGRNGSLRNKIYLSLAENGIRDFYRPWVICGFKSGYKSRRAVFLPKRFPPKHIFTDFGVENLLMEDFDGRYVVVRQYS